MTLLTTSNYKTIKGEALGWKTYILYLAPHKLNGTGKNLCPFASLGCINGCLYTSGMGKLTTVQQARIRKALLWVENKQEFLDILYKEIKKCMKRHAKTNTKFCIRLNGTSDIAWERTNIFKDFPTVQFYDYTKSIKRVLKNDFPNYHLTFSRSESNEEECMEALKNNHSVAMVFKEIPETYKGYKVVNGDEHDLRFLDPKGTIIGLKAKGDAKKDTSGFVITSTKTTPIDINKTQTSTSKFKLVYENVL